MEASGEGVRQLEFQLTDHVKLAIEEARKEVEEKCHSLSVDTVQFHRYGSGFIKSKGLRADAFVQLALQVRVSGREGCRGRD